MHPVQFPVEAGRQPPSAHPVAQGTSFDGYVVHLPPEHAPGLLNVRSVLELTQNAAGGVEQVIPAQGSPMHAPLAQPLTHGVVLLT
jgi:hypothetical protein